MRAVDEEDKESFSVIRNTDVKATLAGIKAALKTPLRRDARVLILSGAVVMALNHPAIDPGSRCLSGGHIGAKACRGS